MRRHEVWRLSYRQNRDLDHLTPEELSERFHDCLNNFRTRTARGKIGLLSLENPRDAAWMVWWTEVMEECKLRGYPFPGPISMAAHRRSFDHAFDPIPNIERAFREAGLGAQPYLLKFGEPKWLKRSFEQGQFRVASASYYDSAAHNHARRDTELTRRFRLNPRNLVSGLAAASDAAGFSVLTAPSDYLLFCLAAQYSARLFGDFASSACIVFHDTARFMERVATALQVKLPKWRIQAGMVNYFDPIRADPRHVIVPWFKPFKHTYQREWRIVCTPPTPATRLEPIEIEIGSLAGYASYVDLETHPPLVLPLDPTEASIRSFGAVQSNPLMNHLLPAATKIQGIVLNKAGERMEDWFFDMQYTDAAGTWHQLKMPISEGLYLMHLFQTADKEQALSLFSRKNKSW